MYRLIFAILLGVAALTAAIPPTPVSAQDTGFTPKSAGTFMVRLRGIGVIADGEGDVLAGGAQTGEITDVDNSAAGEIDLSYFFTDNIAAELIAGTVKHDVSSTPALNADLGEVWLLPPTLTLQYHFRPKQRFSPYLGAGVNYTLFYNAERGDAASINYDDSFGAALQAGADYAITERWGLNLDVKRLFLDVDVDLTVPGLGPLSADVDVDPWIVGAGISYKF